MTTDASLNPPPQPPLRLFTFASGGWVLLVTALICLALATWALLPVFLRAGKSLPPGDGQDPASYLFDLNSPAVPLADILPAMHHRDMVPTIDSASRAGPDPAIPVASTDWLRLRWANAQKRNDPKYAKYLLPNDLVIGVSLNGEACAYPLSTLYVHEIVNDTLGGIPIAVTYNFLSDSTLVFDRRVAPARSAIFAHSGLVYNSNMLMYDRSQSRLVPTSQPAGSTPAATSPVAADTILAGGESLWSQLLMKPLTGADAAAGLTLAPIRYDILTWESWATLHPQTFILNRDMSMANRYADAAPKPYFRVQDKLRFPVSPMPPAGSSTPLKTPIVVVHTPGLRKLYSLRFLAQKTAESGETRTWQDSIGPHTVTFKWVGTRDDVSVHVTSDSLPSSDFRVTHVLWFAWHAMFPLDELIDL